MIRKMVLALAFVLVIAGALAGAKIAQFKTLMASAKSFAQPPESVSSVVVKQEQWEESLTAIGSVAAVQGVTVAPEVPGTVTEIAFDPGTVVAKGDLLVRLDTSLEVAQLRALEAQADLARVNAERERTLRKQELISQSELDTAEATLKQNQADADATRALIEKKTIRAPFAGRLGIRQVNLGQYLDAGKPIVSLQSLTPIFVNFSLPQQDLAQLRTGMAVRLTTDACPGKTFEGQLSTINPDLDPTTRSVSLQARLENSAQLLRPGMFARVEVLLSESHDELVIPLTAVLSEPFGDSVYVIEPEAGVSGKPELAVRQQFIRTGRTRGDFVTVVSGLKAGERIVNAGLFKLRNGMAVLENNAVIPKSTENPRPPDT